MVKSILYRSLKDGKTKIIDFKCQSLSLLRQEISENEVS